MPDRLIDRRGEAHLWLVLEEALSAACAGGDGAVRDARRSFRAVADALSAVGAVDPDRAAAVVFELDDALAVRGLVRPTAFSGHELPPLDAERHPVRRRGDGWLETEIEHHLDLVVDLDAGANRGLGQRVIEVLAPAVRALVAAGSLPRGTARLADVAATFRAAGFPVDHPGGEVDRAWLGFLRDRPAAITDALAPAASATIDVTLGTVGGAGVVVRRVGWSEALLQIEVDAPEPDEVALVSSIWRCSVFDDAGRLHLGQAGLREDGDGSPLVFRLRPGLMAGVASMWIRLSRGAERLEEQVFL